MNVISWFKRRPGHPSDEELSAHLDGMLANGDGQRVEAHLAGCPLCEEQLAELRAVKTLFQDLPNAAAPRSFALTPAQTTRPSAVAPRQGAGSRPRAFAFAPAVAMTLLLAVVGADLLFISGDGAANMANESANRTLAREDAAAGGAKSDAAAAPAGAPPAVQSQAADQAAVPTAPAGGVAAAPAPPPRTGGPESQPTPAAEVFRGGETAQGPTDGSAVDEARGRSLGSVVRVIEVGLLLLLLVSIVAFLRPGLFSKGDT
jgi:anti-sigma factor RsiW